MHCSKKMICLQNSLKNINISVHIIKGLRNLQANTCERLQNTPISYLNVIPKNKIELWECDKKTKEVKSRIWALPLLGVIEYKTCIAPVEDHQINDALITPIHCCLSPINNPLSQRNRDLPLLFCPATGVREVGHSVARSPMFSLLTPPSFYLFQCDTINVAPLAP